MLDRRDLFTGLSGLGLLSAAGARAETAPVGPDLAAILQASGAPAIAGVVLTDKGVIHAVQAGLRHVGSADPVGPNDQWHIGSNTKAMTAALYGTLVQAGKASWEATLAGLFPGLTLDPAWNAVTVRQLLGHRAGVQDAPLMRTGWLMRAHGDKRPLVEQRAELAKAVLTLPPAGQPGAFAYSNIGYILAGAAIERITGQPWEEAITARLFKPLKMDSAGFGPPVGANPWGHRQTADGFQAMDPAGLADNPAALSPAGRVHVALADQAKFARLFLTGGSDLLSPETLKTLSTPVPGEGNPYALGWGVVEGRAWARGPVLTHEGSNTFWHAVATIAPGRKLAVLTACNAAPDASRGAARTLAVALRQQFAPD
jgi:D-alanyl-D-alanine carboxypeptidase